MCRFKSAIILKNGDVLHSNWTDSHEKIISIFELKDDNINNFCRIEFVPTERKFTDINSYILKIDQEKPDWWNDLIKDKIERKLRKIVSGYILNTNKETVDCGCYIIDGNIKVDYFVKGRIIHGGNMKVENGGNMEVINGGYMKVDYGGNMKVENGGNMEVLFGENMEVINGGYMKVDYGRYMKVDYGGNMKVKNGGNMEVLFGENMEVKYGGNMEVENGGNMEVLFGENMEVKHGDDMKVKHKNMP